MTERDFLDILSGANRSLHAEFLRGVLHLAEIPYLIASEARNLTFDAGLLHPARIGIPVISVGNLTTGGTGKTPVVAWLVHQLAGLLRRPGILSRGYRSLDSGQNDEKLLLDRLCPGIPHVQNRDRIQGAHVLLEQFPADVLVLDDAFQHRRIHRDFNLVLIDALNPWGYGHLLPRGLLRERRTHLRRADAIFLTRADLVPDAQATMLLREIAQWTSAPVLRTAFVPTRLVNASGVTVPLENVASRQAAAVCGIGNPDGFLRTLAVAGLSLPSSRLLPFPDHHHYTAEDRQQLADWVIEQQADLLLTTGKDLVKLSCDRIGPVPLWAVDIELTFLDDGEAALRQIRDALARATTVP